MPQPRLIHLADFAAEYSGSFIPMLVSLATASRPKGWAVEVILPERARGRPWLQQLTDHGISYRFLDVTQTGTRRWASWLITEVTRGRLPGSLTRDIEEIIGEKRAPTILHTHFSGFDIAAAQAARGRPDSIVIWHEHSLRRTGWRGSLGGLIKYRVFGRAVKRFLPVSEDVTASISRLARPGLVTFVPNAIDTKRFVPPSPVQRRRARAELGIDEHEIVLLHFGWDWRRKGGDLFLASVAILRGAQVPGIRAIIVGRLDATEAVRTAQLQSHVTVIKPTEEVRDLYAAADVLISCSRSEGMPFAVLEALASGVPVVASDIPGHAFISHQSSACLLTQLESRSIAAGIRKVIDWESGERERELAAARGWLVEHMGLTSWARSVMTIYEDELAVEAVGAIPNT